MAKKKDETTVKDTKKAAAKTAAKATAKKTTAKSKTDTKVTNITEIGAEEKALETSDEEQAAEKNLEVSCQAMMSSIIEWSMDSLMYSNIMLISKKMNISMEEAAVILDVDPNNLTRLSLVYAAYSNTMETEKISILGKYSDRIKPLEPEKKTGKGKKSTNKK